MRVITREIASVVRARGFRSPSEIAALHREISEFTREISEFTSIAVAGKKFHLLGISIIT